MSSPSDPQTPVKPARTGPSTQEIPVVQPAGATAAGPLPPHPGAVAQAPVPMDAAQPTGPVDFVPGLPGLGTPPVPHAAPAPPPPPGPPTATQTVAPVWPDTLEADDEPARPGKERRVRAPRGPRNRAAVLGLGLAVLSLVLLELGLSLDFRVESYWSAVPLWSAFATLCGVLAVLAFAASYPTGSRLRSSAVWRIAAAGLVGLAVFWVLVVLPVVASDRGFLLTAALGALGGALWIGPGRKN
ncbi:hypothetical protein [Blastococcus sp. CT_GayMR16]|uniref:hypothetical protein n=1 Tax=Blastococcus sp. CT_GayMR16 TaxID=2559607 RepID=UPI0010735E6B|nr:hypothetical protein [Blastococcus sp. CT_GayMR16]TFV85746.1 hypothetical protein E4P38_19430 [Blastococcus sp. CT_GayMR16]